MCSHCQAQANSKKTKCVECGKSHRSHYDSKAKLIRDLPCGDLRVYLEATMRRCRCRMTGKVRQEKFDWLSTMNGFTKRFAFYVGRRCQESTIKTVAAELNLDWKTVKALEKEYLMEKLARAGEPAPHIIGIDEIAIRKGHVYRIVVSDLETKRPIWFGGSDRSEVSMNLFYEWLNSFRCKEIRLAVMDMWKAFEKSAKKHIPDASILYDKFHVMRHVSEALDRVRKSEYQAAAEKDRRFIKGQKYTLLSSKANLSIDGKSALKKLLEVNKRLNTAYVLKESFGQLWNYKSEAWARKFFDNWKASLKRRGLKPFEKVVKLVEKHWDGIAAFCHPENKVSLGFVEGLNNKIRVIQKRAYGLRDEEYLRLKVLTCTLPELPYS